MNRLTLSILAVSLLATVPAAADPATLLGAYTNWSAYSTGSGSDKICYALSQPRAVEPRKARRDPIYVLVSDYPGRKVKAEPQIVLGYPVKDDTPASLAVGPDKFTFFARNEGKAGKAWLKSLDDNQRLIDAMKAGVSAVARAVSSRGTKTVDTYSLAGFSDALAKIHDACGM
jgi:hypothetical protein